MATKKKSEPEHHYVLARGRFYLFDGQYHEAGDVLGEDALAEILRDFPHLAEKREGKASPSDLRCSQ